MGSLARQLPGEGLPAGISPEMMKTAMEMMGNLPPEQLQTMMSAAGGGTVPQLSPEMLKSAAEMAKNMTPEDMARWALQGQWCLLLWGQWGLCLHRRELCGGQ